MKKTIDPSTFEPVFERKSATHWIIQLEEDPETGDVIMPLPEEMLQSQGWQIGDELTWNIEEDGTATLTRQSTDPELKPGL